MSGIHVIDVFLVDPHYKSWVLDIGSIAHIYNSMQEQHRPRILAKDDVMMQVRHKINVVVVIVIVNSPSIFRIYFTT